jgi:glycerol uptake facilitator-like aquaporin
VLLFISQILGGIVASALVECMFPGALNVQTTLGGETSVVQGLFIEMFLTAQLVFTIFMLAAEKHKATFIAPVGEFLLWFVCATQRSADDVSFEESASPSSSPSLQASTSPEAVSTPRALSGPQSST